MNVLVVHDVPGLGDAGSPSLLPVVRVSRPDAADLPELVASADFIAIASTAAGESYAWSQALKLVVARDIPMATVKLLPSSQFCASHLSGTCSMRKGEGGTVEVQCLAQQTALRRATARLNGEPDDGQHSSARLTRFIFDGE